MKMGGVDIPKAIGKGSLAIFEILTKAKHWIENPIKKSQLNSNDDGQPNTEAEQQQDFTQESVLQACMGDHGLWYKLVAWVKGKEMSQGQKAKPEQDMEMGDMMPVMA